MKLIVITGQTGTGKTAYALKLAKKINGELISADSRQVYKYLDIVTGKDLPENSKFEIRNSKFPLSSSQFASIGYFLLEGKRVWLYDIVTPDQAFSSHDFVVCARAAIEEIKKRGKMPIIVGGSYLYIKHLLYGIDTENIPPDWDLRDKFNQFSVLQLQEKLKSVDAGLFNKLNDSDRKNPHRLIRKIEIALSRNYPRGVQSKNTEVQSYSTPGVSEFIGLKFSDTDKMKQVITQRVEERLKKGTVEETKKILKKGYSASDPGLNTIGYKQIVGYLARQLTLKKAVDQWILAESQYARRQYTFMKKDKNIIWQTV